MTFNIGKTSLSLLVDDQPITYVIDFRYMGSMMLTSQADPRRWKALAWSTYWGLEKLWRDRSYTTCISILLYGCETWLVDSDVEKGITAFATSRYHIMRGVKQTDRVTNSVIISTAIRQLSAGQFSEDNSARRLFSARQFSARLNWSRQIDFFSSESILYNSFEVFNCLALNCGVTISTVATRTHIKEVHMSSWFTCSVWTRWKLHTHMRCTTQRREIDELTSYLRYMQTTMATRK